MTGETKNTPADSQEATARKKGWWGRFLDRLAKANAESRDALCRH